MEGHRERVPDRRPLRGTGGTVSFLGARLRRPSRSRDTKLRGVSSRYPSCHRRLSVDCQGGRAGGNFTCGYAAVRAPWEGRLAAENEARRAFYDIGVAMDRLGRSVAGGLSDGDDETAKRLLRFLDRAKQRNAVEASRDWPDLRA